RVGLGDVASFPTRGSSDLGEPVTGALVDIWHCNARGAYSGWSKVNPDQEVDVGDIGSIPRTDDDTYLRGGQFTDKKGIVRFTTIDRKSTRLNSSHVKMSYA